MVAASRFGIANHLAFRAIAALCAVPKPVQARLTGGPIERDGLTLEPELQLLVRAGERIALRATPAIRTFRAQQDRATTIIGGPPKRGVIGAVRDLEIAVDGERGDARSVERGDARSVERGDTRSVERSDTRPAKRRGHLRARHYAPLEPSAGAPLLVFFHGGGFVFGNLDTHDAPCRLLCQHAGAHVLAIDYRLAPEHPFPAAVEDARAALNWAYRHADELGADSTRVGVIGDSAGANLAAVVSQLASRDGGPAPACQVLIYPAVDRVTRYPSLDLFADGFFLTSPVVSWFHDQYAGAHPREDTRLSPSLTEDLSGLAPTLLVTAGFDMLRDEGEAYGRRLAASGNKITVRRFGTLLHGFLNMVGISPACHDAVVEIAGATRVLLARSSA